MAAAPAFDAAEALRFLEHLGLDPARVWFRSIKPGSGANVRRRHPKRPGWAADLHGFNAEELAADARDGSAIYFITGDADTASGIDNNGNPTGCVTDADVHSCSLLFLEWDNKPVQWQIEAWRELGLPEPSAIVPTGGKSAHNHWRLTEPLEPDAWRHVQSRLIDFTGADTNNKNPSRLMRLPGAPYFDKRTRRPTGAAAAMLHSGPQSYRLEEIEACIPEPEPELDLEDEARDLRELVDSSATRADLPPRTLEEVNAAAEFVPARVGGEGTYQQDRNALCGCSAALAEAGCADPDAAAVALLGGKWPSRKAAEQCLATTTTRKAASFWAIAGQHGYDLRRQRPACAGTGGSTVQPDDSDHQGRDKQQEVMALAKSRKPPARLSPHDVKRLLPERLGAIRSNIRTGEIVTEKGTRSGNDLGRLYVLLCDERETWPKEATADAVAVIAAANTYDPVEQYLQGIATPPLPMEQWQRLDQHLLGIDHPIAAAFLPRYLISAVARTMEPGCDVRQMLVLIGPQWRGKTALGRILFGAAHWVEGVGNMDRDALQKAHTAWGVELAELDGVSRRSDPEKLKAFLTEPVDTIQLKYDRHPGRHPRRFVFWGTANSPPLNDPTGSTRFVCIEIPDRMLPLDWAVEHRDAIWARALEQHRSGVQWTAITEEERQAIEAMNTDFQQQDPWAEAITEHLADAEKHERLPVKIPDLLRKMDVTTDRQTKALAARVRAIAERLGWKHRRGRRNGSDPLAGLWPPEPSTVHGVHPPCTLTPARPDASQGSRSGGAVHPVHPSFYEKEKTGKEGEATSPPAHAAQNAEGLPPRRVHGMHGPQTDGAAVDQPVHPNRAPITGKPPTFNVNPWAGTNARPPRSDADRLHDRQAQQRTQHEVELLEQQMWDQTA